MAEIVVQILVDPFLVGKHDAAEAAALAVDVLGRRIDDDMRAELQRLLLQRRGEDVVHHQPRADRVGERRDRRDVDHFERRVGRAFEEEQLRVRPDRLFPVLDVGAVDQRRLDAVFRRQRLDHPAAGAEQRARRHDVVAGLEAAQDRRRDGRHARRHGAGVLGAFQRAHALFEHVDGRVGVARIDEAGLLALEARLGGLGACRRHSPASGRSLPTSRRAGSAACPNARAALPASSCAFSWSSTCPKQQKTGRESRNRSIWPYSPTVL